MTGIDESNFAVNLLPKEKIAFLKMLERFDANLGMILIEELKQGNKILSVYDNLSEAEMLVGLSHPFKAKYDIAGLKFFSSIDPHNGGDYYSTTSTRPYTLTAPLKH
jgi:hypothetical protein